MEGVFLPFPQLCESTELEQVGLGAGGRGCIEGTGLFPTRVPSEQVRRSK